MGLVSDYSDIWDISAFYFGADFPFNIDYMKNLHRLVSTQKDHILS